jgi:hypothetical protein
MVIDGAPVALPTEGAVRSSPARSFGPGPVEPERSHVSGAASSAKAGRVRHDGQGPWGSSVASLAPQRGHVVVSGMERLRQQGTWYLSIWAPNACRVALDTDLLGLCEQFVDVGSCDQDEVLAWIVEQFGLTNSGAEEFIFF